MKPKPFSSLNHLTVPVAMSLLPGESRTSDAEGVTGCRGLGPAKRAETYQGFRRRDCSSALPSRHAASVVASVPRRDVLCGGLARPGSGPRAARAGGVV